MLTTTSISMSVKPNVGELRMENGEWRERHLLQVPALRQTGEYRFVLMATGMADPERSQSEIRGVACYTRRR